jgi:hypothetical protein
MEVKPFDTSFLYRYKQIMVKNHGLAQKALLDALNYEGDECLPWPFSHDSHGYGQINYQGRLRRVSNLICEKVNGPSRLDAAHSCGHGWCINKRHLSWKTRKSNEADKLLHGTHQNGERNHQAKLTEAQVWLILSSTYKASTLALRFNVSPQHIHRIRRRERWN